MIRVRRGALSEATSEAVLRPVRSDLAPVTPASRDASLAAGPAVATRLEGLGEVPVGGAVVTPAGALPSSFLIHVVVLSPEEPMTELSVQRALVNGLRRAREWGIGSLALPPLGGGAGSLDPERWARLVVDVLRDHVAGGGEPHDFEIVVETPFEEDLFRRELGEGADGAGEPGVIP